MLGVRCHCWLCPHPDLHTLAPLALTAIPGTPPRVGSRVAALTPRQRLSACRTAPLVIDHAPGGPAKLKRLSRSPEEPRGGRYSDSKSSRLSDQYSQRRAKDREDYREERGDRRMASHALPGYGPGRGAEDASVVDFIKVGLLRGAWRPRRAQEGPSATVPPPSHPAAGCRRVVRLACAPPTQPKRRSPSPFRVIGSRCNASSAVASGLLGAALVLPAKQLAVLPRNGPVGFLRHLARYLRHPPAQISSKEEPRHYSAKIAWNARNNSHMPLLATGAPAINCAIKVRAAAMWAVEQQGRSCRPQVERVAHHTVQRSGQLEACVLPRLGAHCG